MRGMRIFHIATLDDWKQAQETGTYTTSTYGRTLVAIRQKLSNSNN